MSLHTADYGFGHLEQPRINSFVLMGFVCVCLFSTCLLSNFIFYSSSTSQRTVLAYNTRQVNFYLLWARASLRQTLTFPDLEKKLLRRICWTINARLHIALLCSESEFPLTPGPRPCQHAAKTINKSGLPHASNRHRRSRSKREEPLSHSLSHGLDTCSPQPRALRRSVLQEHGHLITL